MKSTPSFVFTFYIFFLFSLTGCDDDCEDAFSLADLLISNVEQLLDNENNAQTYKIIHTVLNSAEELACPDDVATATTHTNEIPIKFSSDGDFSNNVQTIANKTVSGSEIAGNKSYQMESEIVFDVDGFYQITTLLDINNEVEERDEANNESNDSIGGRLKKSNKNTIILEVKNTGNLRPKMDENGNPIYIQSFTIKIKQ